MSHIDTFDHEYIGHLGYLPIYHPLEVINGDFHADSSNILFGGGAGEHPVLIISNMDCLVARFILSQYGSDYHSSLPNISNVIKLAGALDHTLFNYVDWDFEREKRFTRMVRALGTSFCAELPFMDSVNEWVSNLVGELVYFCLPEMIVDKSLLDISLDPTYKCNISTPIGYPNIKYGRLTRKNRVIYGYSLADRRVNETKNKCELCDCLTDSIMRGPNHESVCEPCFAILEADEARKDWY